MIDRETPAGHCDHRQQEAHRRHPCAQSFSARPKLGSRCHRPFLRECRLTGKAEFQREGPLLVEPAVSVHERVVALTMLKQASKGRPITVGGDKGFDTREVFRHCRAHDITPHVAQNTASKGGSAIDTRTTRHAGYEISQRKRKLIETTFGWPKQYGGLRRMMYRGIDKVRGQVKLVTCAFNLL